VFFLCPSGYLFAPDASYYSGGDGQFALDSDFRDSNASVWKFPRRRETL
jgi:hypothetical protein